MSTKQESLAADVVIDHLIAQRTQLLTTTLNITQVAQNFVSIAFNTLPGNNPNAHGNYVAVWQTNDNNIPWNTPALKTKKITGTNSAGDTVIDGINLTANSYLVAYGVGPELSGSGQQKYGNLAATAFIPAIGQPQRDPFAPSLRLDNLGTNSLTATFRLPSNITPLSNGAWIGLWEANSISYNSQPDYSNNVTVDKATGQVFLTDINVGRGTTYTLGLFLSGWAGNGRPNTLTAAAAELTFDTPEF